jgi:hypothetical protein
MQVRFLLASHRKGLLPDGVSGAAALIFRRLRDVRACIGDVDSHVTRLTTVYSHPVCGGFVAHESGCARRRDAGSERAHAPFFWRGRFEALYE